MGSEGHSGIAKKASSQAALPEIRTHLGYCVQHFSLFWKEKIVGGERIPHRSFWVSCQWAGDVFLCLCFHKHTAFTRAYYICIEYGKYVKSCTKVWSQTK